MRAARRPRGKLLPIETILKRAYPSREPADLAALRAFAWWARVVPPRVARNARPVRLVRGTLIVHARSAAWAQELSFLQEDLLTRIREGVPSAGVVRLRIKLGPLPPPASQIERRSPKVTPLSVAQLPGEVARALAHVGDEALRDVLSRAARMSLAPPPASGRGGKRAPS
ncbi:MAG: DUF721 domain-containing protein [Sandaracinaceae bacterium]|nr:DUF721 domain-containing protein [Sandaracinaceae bacterium]